MSGGAVLDPLQVNDAIKALVQRTIQNMLPTGIVPGGHTGAGPTGKFQHMPYLLADEVPAGFTPIARKLTVGPGVTNTDSGPGGTVALAFDTTANLAITGSLSFAGGDVVLDGGGITLKGDRLAVLLGGGAEDVGGVRGQQPGEWTNSSTVQLYSEGASGRAWELYARGNVGGVEHRVGIAGLSAGDGAISPTMRHHINGDILLEVKQHGALLGQKAYTSGTPTLFKATGAAHTGLTLSTEIPDIDFALNRTVEWAAGNLATQRAVVFRAPTYAFVASGGPGGTSTITDAATVAITGAPAAGANAAITNPWALWVQAGKVKLASDLIVGGVVDGSAGGVRTKPNAGAPGGGTSGDLTVDTTNSRFYASFAGTAKYAPMGAAGISKAVHASAWTVDDGSGGARSLTSGNTYTTGDLRDGTLVPSYANEVDILIYGKSETDTVNLQVYNADETGDTYHNAMASIAGKWLKGVYRVRLGTGGNAGKLKFTASGADWSFWAVIVGWHFNP